MRTPTAGKVIALRGPVIDVEFDTAPLPPIEEALRVEWDRPGPLVAEVQSHLDGATVRAVALQSTAGLRRGTPVQAAAGHTGDPPHRRSPPPRSGGGVWHMSKEPNGLLRSVRRRRVRHETWLHHGEPSFARYLAQVGVLGWMIVVPTLLGVFLGRWIDHQLGSGIFWTGPLMLVALAFGCWSAWRWMHGQ